LVTGRRGASWSSDGPWRKPADCIGNRRPPVLGTDLLGTRARAKPRTGVLEIGWGEKLGNEIPRGLPPKQAATGLVLGSKQAPGRGPDNTLSPSRATGPAKLRGKPNPPPRPRTWSGDLDLAFPGFRRPGGPGEQGASSSPDHQDGRPRDQAERTGPPPLGAEPRSSLVDDQQPRRGSASTDRNRGPNTGRGAGGGLDAAGPNRVPDGCRLGPPS